MSLQYDLETPVNLSALGSITQAQLLQALNTLRGVNNIGGVIVMSGASSAHPDVTNNPRFTKYIWLDTQTAGAVLLKIYQGTYPSDTYADWSTVAIADGSITAAKLANYAVSVLNGSAAPKIAYRQDAASDVTKASYILRLDTNGQYVEVASLATIMANFPLNPALISGPAADLNVLTWNGTLSQASWQAINLATAITNNSIALNKLVTGTAYYHLRNGAAGIPEEVTNSDKDAANGLFPDNSIKLERLYYLAAADGDFVRFNGTNWIKHTPFFNSVAALPTSDTSVSIAHGLGAIPRHLIGYIKNTSGGALNGYAANDLVELSAFKTRTGANTGTGKGLIISADATNITISSNVGANPYYVVNPKSGGAVADLAGTGWTLWAYASL